MSEFPRCCNPKAKELFHAIFDRMPWLYEIFFRWPLRELDLSDLLNLITQFTDDKMLLQKERHSQALQSFFERLKGSVRYPHLQKRAYELWQEAGSPPGDGLEFWTKAEQEEERSLFSELVNVLGSSSNDRVHRR